MSAVAQAELMEKEKHIMEIQQKVQMLQSQVSNLANNQAALEREKKRCQITNVELGRCQADATVYRSVGRMFVKQTVADLHKAHSDREAKCVEEVIKLSNEKKRAGESLQRNEAELTQAAKEYMATIQILQNQASAAQGKK